MKSGTIYFSQFFSMMVVIIYKQIKLTLSSPGCFEIIKDTEHVTVSSQLLLGLLTGAQRSEQLSCIIFFV